MEHVAQRAVDAISEPLPADDERAIQRLIVAYGICSDFCMIDQVVDLFTEDAVWDGTEFRMARCSNHDELRAHFIKELVPGMRQMHVMQMPLLSTGDHVDHARGFVPFSAMQAKDGEGVIAAQQAYGIYDDVYRRVRDEWRFEQRTLHLRLVRR